MEKHLRLDGIDYHHIESKEAPPGHTSVHVRISDNGCEFNAVIVAEFVGIKGTRSAKRDDGFDIMSPQNGWWMFERKSKDEMAEETRKKVDLSVEQAEEMRKRYGPTLGY